MDRSTWGVALHEGAPGAPAGAFGVVVGGYYDPQSGQFISVDPLVDMTGQPYSYTGGDPVNSSDRNGLGVFCSGSGEKTAICDLNVLYS